MKSESIDNIFSKEEYLSLCCYISPKFGVEIEKSGKVIGICSCCNNKAIFKKFIEKNFENKSYG